MASVHKVKYSDEAVLESLGYKQEFKRAFKPVEVFGLVISVFGLVPSMASVLSTSASSGGAVTMVWGWAVGASFIMCVGMSLSELASSAPTSGGLYYLTYKLTSPRYRNLLSWITGFASTLGWIVGSASVDWGLTVQMAAALNIGSDGQLLITKRQSFGIYAAIVLSQAVLCSLGTKLLARLQGIYVFLNIFLCLVIIVALPIATPKELKNPPSYVFGNFTNLSGWPDPLAFMLGLLAPLWTIGGYDVVIHMSEELSNAAVTAPWAIVSAIATIGLLGWVLNVVLAVCMGPDVNNIVNSPISQPMAQIFLNSFGKTWTLVLWPFVMLLQYMMGSSGVLAASRQSFAFARDGALPFSKQLYRINSYTGTPVNTVLFTCFVAFLLGLLGLLDSAAINALFTAAVTAMCISYGTPIVARLVFDNGFKPGPFSLGVFGAPIAVIAVLFMFVMFVVLCFPSSPSPQASTMNYASLVVGGWMLLAIVWYYFPKYGGVYWFEGPAITVETMSPRDSSGSIVEDGKEGVLA